MICRWTSSNSKFVVSRNQPERRGCTIIGEIEVCRTCSLHLSMQYMIDHGPSGAVAAICMHHQFNVHFALVMCYRAKRRQQRRPRQADMHSSPCFGLLCRILISDTAFVMYMLEVLPLSMTCRVYAYTYVSIVCRPRAFPAANC
jgi:hypothetical protein